MSKSTPLIPNLFIVGAPKAGTFSLYYYLKQHPEIFMSSIKEPNHFVNAINNTPTLRPLSDWSEYIKVFSGAKYEKYLGEATPSYLHCPESPARIKQVSRYAKIIIILRNPVERAFSNWYMDIREGFQKKSFITSVMEDVERAKDGKFYMFYMYYQCSLYYESIQRYLTHFGKNTKIFLFEDICKDTGKMLFDIVNFLEIPNIKFDFSKKINESGYPRNWFMEKIYQNMHLRKVFAPIIGQNIKMKIKSYVLVKKNVKKLEEKDRSKLMHLFEDDIIKTQKLINRDLSSWLK